MGAGGMIRGEEIGCVFGSSCFLNLARLLENHTYEKKINLVNDNIKILT